MSIDNWQVNKPNIKNISQYTNKKHFGCIQKLTSSFPRAQVDILLLIMNGSQSQVKWQMYWQTNYFQITTNYNLKSESNTSHDEHCNFNKDIAELVFDCFEFNKVCLVNCHVWALEKTQTGC